MQSNWNGFLGFLRNQDSYGTPISLNYQGDDTFKTIPGGLISIVFIFLFTCYCIVKAQTMIKYQNWRITQQIVVADLDELIQPSYMKDLTNISMGF